MNKDFDQYECAEHMLRMVNGGKSPERIRLEMKKMGYTSKQISEAGQILIDAQ